MALLRYTTLRLALFLGTAALLYLVGIRNLFICALVAILVSGLVSVVALKRVRSEVGASISRKPARKAAPKGSVVVDSQANGSVDADPEASADLESDVVEVEAVADAPEPPEPAAPVVTPAAPKKSKRRPSALTRISDRIDATARAEDAADDAERQHIGHALPPIARPDLPGWEQHVPDLESGVDASAEPRNARRSERQVD